MRILSLLAVLIFAATSSAAYGITIGGIDIVATADSVISSTGNYYDSSTPPSAPSYIDASQLSADLTDANAATFVFSPSTLSGFDSYVQLGFSSGIYNGAGNDLALFFAGIPDANYSPSVELDVNGQPVNIKYQPVLAPEPTILKNQYSPYCTTNPDGSQTCGYNMSVALINLDDFGLAYNARVDSIKIHFNSFSAALGLAGSMYNTPQPSTVPLPLPALLFGSGLSLLGLFGRKRKQ